PCRRGVSWQTAPRTLPQSTTVGPPPPGAAATSVPPPSPRSPPSARASRTSRSPGDPRPEGPAEPERLTPSRLRALAANHGIRPKRSLGQHFLIEPSLARRIVELAEVRPGDRVVEVGAGLGSVTVARARAGADVVAVEV